MALPLRRQVVILNLTILIPLVLVIGWSARRTYDEQIEHLQGETRTMAAAVVLHLQRERNLVELQPVLQSIPLPPDSVVTITDDRGIVLARSREPDLYVGRPMEAPVPARNVPSSLVRQGLDGIERVFGNATFEAGPWNVSVGIPTRVAVDRVRPIFERNLAIGLVVTLFTLLLEFVIVRRYVHAFDRAVAAAGRVASGDLAPLSPIAMPSLELERLQDSFGDMVNRLREAREAVAAQVTEERRMREELESLQRQVIRQERLAAIGVLVSGVAHELNNPLQAILGFAELLQLRKDLPPHIRADLELIQKEATRASGIIRNLSRFGRQQTSDPTPVRLKDVIASVIELRQRNLEEHNIQFDCHDTAARPVLAVFTELQQVVLNFVINAEQAVLHGMLPRRLTIRTAELNGKVRLEVQDSGPGVPRQHEPKLFQPFFTTKAVGEGTGLGLSVSYGIIQSHGGTIGYRAAPGGGAIFYFELPAANQARP